VLALFAGVEVETAFQTLSLSLRIREVLEQGSAFGASRNRSGSGHVDRSRSEGVFFFRSGCFLEFFLCSRAGILVSALPVLAIGQRESPFRLSAVSHQENRFEIYLAAEG